MGTMNTVVISSLRTAVPILRRRYQASKFVGLWEAHQLCGRDIDPMPMLGASLAEISLRPLLWSSILDVRAHDFSSDDRRREHDGYIVFDPSCPSRAVRTVDYRDSMESSRQSIEVIDEDTLLVIPGEPGYDRHVLCRVKSLLGLN
jgi:hypothetical protein